MKSLGNAKTNRDFIDISAMSGHRLAIVDPNGKHYHFSTGVDDEVLGLAVVDVLNSSRSLSVSESSALRAKAQEQYESWVASVMAEHKYRTRREMFEEMRSCRIERLDDVITFFPLRHDKLEGWTGDGVTVDDQVVVTASTELGEIGAALRQAFERCT